VNRVGGKEAQVSTNSETGRAGRLRYSPTGKREREREAAVQPNSETGKRESTGG